MRSRKPASALGPISRRAARWGIEVEYRDAQGLLRIADPQGLARVMAAVAGSNEPARRLLSRTVVVPQEQGLQLRLTTDARTTVRWEISSDAKIVSGTSNSATIRLPGDLPLGIYGLKVVAQSSGKERIEEATLLRAPSLAFQGSETGPRRLWALAVQLYGVRSRRNWGHGDFTDLLGLLELAAELGAGGVALNPLHALFDDDAGAASPYSPNSRLFLNSLYIDVEAYPGISRGRRGRAAAQSGAVGAPRIGRSCGRGERKNARTCARLCKLSSGRCDAKAGVRKFRRERGPVLARFACFEFLRRRFRKPWREWPELWRNPAEEALEALTQSDGEAIGFFEFVQVGGGSATRRPAAGARTSWACRSGFISMWRSGSIRTDLMPGAIRALS